MSENENEQEKRMKIARIREECVETKEYKKDGRKRKNGRRKRSRDESAR